MLKYFKDKLSALEKNSIENRKESILKKYKETLPKSERIKHNCDIDDDSALLLAALFYPPYYKHQIIDLDITGDDNLFDHYLSHGIKEDIPPGPLLDIELVKAALESRNDGIKNIPVVIQWLRFNRRVLPVPTDRFDSRYYSINNPDVISAGIDPFIHFLTYGEAEGRLPFDLDKKPVFKRAYELRALTDAAVYNSLLTELSINGRPIHIENYISQIRANMNVDFYLLQYMDALDSSDVSSLVAHYLAVGQRDGARINYLFNKDEYSKRYIQFCLDNDNVAVPITGNEYLHWLYIGKDLQIVPTVIFDEEYYSHKFSDLKNWPKWIFEHYFKHGKREKLRSPNPYFDSKYIVKQLDGKVNNDFIHGYITSALSQPVSPSQRLTFKYDNHDFDIKETSEYEEILKVIYSKKENLKSSEVIEQINKAKSIEPMIAFPPDLKKFTYPPYAHDLSVVWSYSEKVKKSLNIRKIKTMIFLPHSRKLSGASMNGLSLAKGVADNIGEENVLVVYTDANDIEMVPGKCQSFNINEIFPNDFPYEYKKRVLLDLIRSVCTESIYIVNSRLMWDLAIEYNSQLSQEYSLNYYLFCWDINIHGEKGGYPIREFQHVMNTADNIYVDTHYLKGELDSRYCLPDNLIKVIYAPSQPNDIKHYEVFRSRRSENVTIRCFWAGRFDKQKIVNVVFEIMADNPHIHMDMYGKPVLNDDSFCINDAPSNIKFCGLFDEFTDLPLSEYDFYLYTSAWDGMPNMIVLASSCGIPIVASDVGGVGELVSKDTGYPVTDYMDHSEYTDAINDLLLNLEETVVKAKKLKTLVNSKMDYKKCVYEVLSTNLKGH